MATEEAIKTWQEAGQRWLKGEEITEVTFGDNHYVFNPKQIIFINSKKRKVLYSGGYGCGKTLPLLIKIILLSLFFPNNLLLLGRKTLQDIERTTLPDLFDLLPQGWYRHRVKDGIIEFFNGSRIILFGLDALQEGSIADIKKAQQKIKSLNLGGFFIDQLEEIEFDVFDALCGRLRRGIVPIRQGNMTTNPANFWAYHYFKLLKVLIGDHWYNPKKVPEDIELIEGSMLDNKENLPPDYLEDQLNHNEQYVKRYVHGIWSPDVLIKNVVIAKEYIDKFEIMKMPPIAVEEGCEIWEQPKKDEQYQMGVDPSEGVIDPGSISIVSKKTGKKVAKYRGFIPIAAQGEKVKFLYYKYNKPRIVPEANSSGAALIEAIKDLKIFHRRVFEYREKREIEKVGWRTSFASKQALISHFQNLCRQGFPKIYDEETIEEFKTFIWSDSAKQKGAGAQRNYHDDDTMSTFLSYWELKPIKVEDFEALKKELLKAKRSRILRTQDHI